MTRRLALETVACPDCDLLQRMPPLPPQALSADAEYRVAIEVQSFRSASGEAAVLDAVWTVRRAQDGRTETRRTTEREAVQENGYDALAAAHSHALARLSRDIADTVRALDRFGPPSRDTDSAR